MLGIKRLLRASLNWYRLCLLQYAHEGLILETGVRVHKSQLGRFNLLCERATLVHSSLGDYSYVGRGAVVSFSTIGKFCSIGPGVLIGLGKHPSRDFISTHPIFYSCSFPTCNRFARVQGFEEYAAVTIGHDVWIGANVLIGDGVAIGSGAVIGAGAIVTRDVAPYSVVAGVPAKEIRKRFEPEQIAALLQSNWWDRSDDWLKTHHQAFHSWQRFEELLVS
jgi:acetyltransferase-like isoleucine patch superfamily enzyme